jgi:hypothetical protein
MVVVVLINVDAALKRGTRLLILGRVCDGRLAADQNE